MALAGQCRASAALPSFVPSVTGTAGAHNTDMATSKAHEETFSDERGGVGPEIPLKMHHSGSTE